MKTKEFLYLFILVSTIFLFYADPALARDVNQGVKVIYSDFKLLAYSLCGVVAVAAGILVLVNMQAGIAKYMAVVLAIIIIATSLSAVTYLTNNFGG